jgi:hypothetical protein
VRGWPAASERPAGGREVGGEVKGHCFSHLHSRFRTSFVFSEPWLFSTSPEVESKKHRLTRSADGGLQNPGGLHVGHSPQHIAVLEVFRERDGGPCIFRGW